MDLLRAYSRRQTADSIKSRQYIVDSKQGKAKGFLSTVYCPLSTEKGIALVMVLVLAAISLSIMAALIYMLVGGTKTSGIQKRYKTALEAGVGGGEVSYQFIALRGDATNQTNFVTSLTNAGLTTFVRTPATCQRSGATACLTYPAYTGLAAKLNLPTSCWTGCNTVSGITIDPADNTTYDMRFDIVGTTTTYRVYAKVVDTVEGNSAGDEGLIKGGVVSSNSGDVTVQSRPYLYTIEIDAENQNPNNVDERAKLSVLYQY